MLSTEATSESMNCEGDSYHSLLTSVDWDKDKIGRNDFDANLPTLTLEELIRALNASFSSSDDAALEYVSGHFFRQLLKKLHSSDCARCSSFGQKIVHCNVPQSVHKSEVFLYLKRFSTENATLYKCNNDMVLLVKCVMKVSNYVFENHPTQRGIVGQIVSTIRKHVLLPALCSDVVLTRFLQLIARTMILYKIKWFNDTLKTSKVTKASKKPAKLRKLMHQ
jgi:hypothetical protein